MGHFWPHGNNLKNLGKGPLNEAACQISKALVFWFQTRRFFKVFANFSFLLPWQLEFCMELNSLNIFEKGPLKDHF